MGADKKLVVGSITMLDAKHGICDCLGFVTFKNYNGTRLGYMGVVTVNFMLKETINNDQLYFETELSSARLEYLLPTTTRLFTSYLQKKKWARA